MKANKPLNEKISICIPTYNRARFLEYLLGWFADNISIILGITIIISDDNSTDDTAEVVRRFSDFLSIKYVINPYPKGLDSNLRFAMCSAETEYIVPLADDDFLHFDNLFSSIILLENQPDAVAIYSSMWYYDAVAGMTQGKFFELDKIFLLEKGKVAAGLNFIIDRHIFPECAIYRKSVIDFLGSGHRHVFFPFIQFAQLILRGHLLFQTMYCHSLFCVKHPVLLNRDNFGSFEAMELWDRTRGGLEYIVGIAKRHEQLSFADECILNAKIEKFISDRMRVAVRLHINAGNFLDAYMIASRMRGRGEWVDVEEWDALHYLASVAHVLKDLNLDSARLESGLSDQVSRLLDRNPRIVSTDPNSPLITHAQISEYLNRL